MPDESTSSAAAAPAKGKYGRLPCNAPVRLRRYGQSHWRTGLCTDLGEGGMGFDTEEEVLVVGEIVEIELSRPEGVASYRGRIMYRQLQHYGVGFLEADNKR